MRPSRRGPSSRAATGAQRRGSGRARRAPWSSPMQGTVLAVAVAEGDARGGGRPHLRGRGDEDGERDRRARATASSPSSRSRRASRSRAADLVCVAPAGVRVTAPRCSELSRAAGESLAATATTASAGCSSRYPGPGRVTSRSERRAARARSRGAVRAWLERDAARRGSCSSGVRERRGARPARLRRAGGRSRATEVESRSTREPRRARGRRPRSDGDPIDARARPRLRPRNPGRLLRAPRHAGLRRARRPARRRTRLWLSSHQGGHRFAANVLVLPAGDPARPRRAG